MSTPKPELVQCVLDVTPRKVLPGAATAAGLGAVFLVSGLGLGFLAGAPAAGWTALVVATALAVGVGVFGAVLSAVFQLTGARWGRAYRRLAEASLVFMPLGLLGLVVLIAGGGSYLPWVHMEHLSGGKGLWLVRGFWDARVLIEVLGVDAFCLWFLYWSFRRDFCVDGVGNRFRGALGRFVGRDIRDPEAESARCVARMAVLAPVVCMVFAVGFSMLGFDLIMALEPEFFSTLFGAWYFIGALFSGLALLAVVSVLLRTRLGLATFLTPSRQVDLATLLFAFTLLNADFFWSQFLTIWYAALPDETGYLIERTMDPSLPWFHFSWLTLAGFFLVPFVFLLLRTVKASGLPLAIVGGVVVAGVFLSRFLEVAPAIMALEPGAGMGGALRPLAASGLLFAGLLGIGWYLYQRLLCEVPLFPVGDPIFVREIGGEGPHD